MENKKLKLCALFILGIGLTCLKAQTTMNVKENVGALSQSTLGSIRKLTFSNNNLLINKNNGTTSIYALGNVRYINFSSGILTSTAEQETENLLLFPNPVNNNLQINFQSNETGILQISIMDLQGNIVLQQIQNNQSGTNNTVIDVSELLQGLYVCRLQTNSKTENIKFIKQ